MVGCRLQTCHIQRNSVVKSQGNRTTISDVAKAAKTGKTSVSRYLNGEQHLLSDALKLRIETAIRQLNYNPSQMARSLKKGRTKLIGIIIADITNPYSVDVLRGVEDACQQHGFTLLMCNTNNEVDQEQHYLELFSSYCVEGIVVNAVGMREDAFAKLQHSLLPMVLIDRKIAGLSCDMIGLDNQGATIAATNHLIEQGFEAFLFLSEPLGLVNTRQERLQAFQQTIQRNPPLIACHYDIRLSDTEQLDKILYDFCQRHRGMRKAAISANGAMTLQIARAMRRLRLNWGSDMGLLGFDEMEWAEVAGITTLKQPTYQIGRAALEQLISRINGDARPNAEKTFPGTLIVRESTIR
ncbi:MULTISPECIES: LacI family DNA-binding transcriptional regulator [unclassified Brenneria]|uniref:LacI family DNA-binding transcriptional regulator n=1 Tax=unclassified Brenneria TaxID=2634434 RepID=UPI001557DF48|nr:MULTISPECIES: LacI family DNA-binding transcriptional regulator [unclassified Brenneria]MBJ7220332.1 LacI family DNA-binding transcriptional regulator [Brenneria sp. L3-3C-1]MEE3641577.1 LacI family DNA-binding transcriptional regulator [Brenneria sp. L3_3C_1]MEE3649792.1 LacI family DNA-binding transcriptional regulator [Brenneria sp. HEZEL_4_2_4]NPC99751.1 LacI family DNA-binding transcriptional regulator [Brenneria sp. hezel4-2-4]